MKIEFTGRQTQISKEVRRLAERKLEKIARLLPRMTRAHVILTADKHRQVAEVSVHSRNLDLSAVEVTTNLRLSVSKSMDKLLRQAQTHRAKQRDHRGSTSARGPARQKVASRGRQAPDLPPELPRVIRNRRRAVRPMTLDEATIEMEARTERMRVLYRRVDGRLELIEPDA